MVDLGLSIRIILFSGRVTGWLKKVQLEPFFSFLQQQKKDSKKGHFPTQKKRKVETKKNCGRPTGFNFSHPLDRKQTFFYGQPNQPVCQNTVT